MIDNLPSWTSVYFALTTLLTVYLFYFAEYGCSNLRTFTPSTGF